MTVITKKGLVGIGIILAIGWLLIYISAHQDHTQVATKNTNTATDTETAQPPQTPSYTLSTNQLENDYKANEVAADMKYKGHIVVVSGTIKSIGKDIMDQAYIVIDGENESLFSGVQCMFTKDEEPSVARLSKGEYVTVKGEVSGGKMGVLLHKCTIQ
jgi:hypothetical protein